MSLQEGCHFFVYLNDGSRRYGHAKKNTDIKLHRKHYPMTDLIGYPYGTVFEVNGRHLVPVDEPLIPVDVADIDENDENDNRELVDDIMNQTLKQEDIEKMRKDGATGKDIIQELASSSITFDTKTDFSKKKYLKKKSEKYILRCMLVEANSQTVCEQQFMKEPVRINYMRFDTLAYMMSLSNIHSGSKVMVFDDCMGIVVASIMERLCGYGLVFAVNNNDNRIPAYDCVNRLNFNNIEDKNEYIVDHDETHEMTEIQIPQRELTISDYQANIRNTLLIWHLSDLLKVTPLNHTTDLSTEMILPLPIPVPPPTTVYVPKKIFHTITELPMKHKDGTELSDQEIVNVMKKRQERKMRDAWQPTQEQQIEYLKNGVESLIIASNNPLHEVPLLLPYLAPSGILVVYSQYQAVLAEVFAGLKRSGQWVNITMSENFMRKYQVLPMRTHPYMNMYSNGGYVLTATRVLNINGPNNTKENLGIRTGANSTSTLRRKKLKLMYTCLIYIIITHTSLYSSLKEIR